MGALVAPQRSAGCLPAGPREDAPRRVRLRAGRGEGQLRGSEPGAAPARPQAGTGRAEGARIAACIAGAGARAAEAAV